MDPSYTEKLAPLDMPEHSCTTNTEGGNEKPIVQRNVALGLTRNYAADWTVQDALRELYQNWFVLVPARDLREKERVLNNSF